MNRCVVVLAKRLDLRIGQRDDLVRDLLLDFEITAREQVKAQTVPRSLRQIEKLLGIVAELVAGRGRQRLQRDSGPVIAASELVGARKMIEGPPPLALRQPEETERTMSLVMLRLKRRGAAQGLDRLPRLAKRHQCNGTVVVRRDKRSIRPERLFETANGLLVTALRRNGDAKVVRDRGISRDDGQSRPISGLGIGEPPAL